MRAKIVTLESHALVIYNQLTELVGMSRSRSDFSAIILTL
jgi:hypothetical protein